MARSYLELLRDLLSSVAGREAAVTDAIKALMSFMQKVATGKLIAPSASAVDPEEVVTAIGQATGQPVRGVIFVSAAEPFPRPAWVSKLTYRQLVAQAFSDSVDQTLEERLRRRFSADLQRNFGLNKGFIRQLMVKVQTMLSDALVEAFETGLGWATGQRPPFGLAGNLRSAVFYLLAFAAAGDTSRVSELVPLVRLLPRAVPVGDLRHDPDTWLVLVA